MRQQAEGANCSAILKESGQYDCAHDEEGPDSEYVLPERRRGDGCDSRDAKRRHWCNILRNSCEDDEVEGDAGKAHISVAERNKCIHGRQHQIQQPRRNKRKPVDYKSASKLEYKGQGRVIDRLANENKILKQRVAHFQLALQLSADEDIASSGAVFSGLPIPSPRVTRGRIHKESLARQSGSSDTYSAHQLKNSGKRVRMVDEVNQALAARVKELENSRTVRNNSTKEKLALQEQEIASLREELSVMHSLARAQDRKFDGSEGYAMARRLWTVENELKIAKEAASSSKVELARLRQSKNTRRRAHGVPRGSDDTPAGETRLSPHRPAVPRRQSFPNACRTIPRVKAGKVVRGDGEGEISRGVRTTRTVAAIQEKREEENRDEDPLRHRAHVLERALAKRRSKAQEELRGMKDENARLKKETSALCWDLDGKAKGDQMGLQQLARLRQSENTQRRAHGTRRGSDDTPAGESRLSPHRPAAPPRQPSPNARQTIDRVKAGKVVRGNREGEISRGVRTIRAVAAIQGKDKGAEESLQQRVHVLERALTNMRSKAQGELRAVKAENAHLKKETSALSRDLDGKAKEVQMQLQQVIRLKKQLLQLSGSMEIIERAPAAAKRVFPLKEAPVIAAGGRRLGPSNKTHRSSPRSLRVADQVRGHSLDKGRQHEALTLVKSSARHPCPLSGILDMSEPAPRRHRVSSFSDDGNVTSDTSQKCNSEKCIVDFDGSVRHGDTCILKDMDQGDPIKVKPVEDLAALQGSSRRASKNGSPPIQKGRSTVDLPVTEVTVLGLEKGRLSFGSKQYSQRNSCVSLSGDGRLEPTMEILRRPTHFTVESVPEENTDDKTVGCSSK